MSKLSLVSQYEVARLVAKAMQEQDPYMSNTQHTTQTVVKLIATFAKFITHFFKKIDEFSSIVCEVPTLGHFTLEKNDDE